MPSRPDEGRYPDRRADRALIESIRIALAAGADPDRAAASRAYLKSEMPCLGVRLPEVRRVVRDALPADLPPTPAVAATAARLWRQAEFREERHAASALTALPALAGILELMPLHREMIVTGAWWDHVDEAAHRVESTLAAHPAEMTALLRGWMVDADRWIRRVSVIAQLGRRSATDVELLGDAILANAADPDFFLRKAIGWALRQYARTDPEWVRTFVDTHRGQLSLLSQREALKHV